MQKCYLCRRQYFAHSIVALAGHLSFMPEQGQAIHRKGLEC